MVSTIKIVIGLVYMAVAATTHACILLLLWPSRKMRITSCNYWGWITGPIIMWLSGSRVHLRGQEHMAGPAIFVSNHTSMLDIFIGIWQAPAGTVGIAKKEIVQYPFFGQLYWLSGHLLLDRSNRERAVAAMQELAATVRDYGLSIWMWPEGTRSRDGHLLPFKKGLYHLAVQTGLPIVPVVVSGMHHAWEVGTFNIQEVDIGVDMLPPIDTSGWADRDMQACLDEVHALFVAHLPEDQQPTT